MIRELKLPDAGMGITEGTIIKWHKAEGEPILPDELLAEVETAKAVVEVRSPVAGFMEKILFAEGETAQTDAAIAVLREQRESLQETE